MKCSNENCKHENLTKKDFYWQIKSVEPTLKNPRCKYCISDENKKKYQEKKPEKLPFAWI